MEVHEDLLTLLLDGLLAKYRAAPLALLARGLLAKLLHLNVCRSVSNERLHVSTFSLLQRTPAQPASETVKPLSHCSMLLQNSQIIAQAHEA
jgi:hypothetical protein